MIHHIVMFKLSDTRPPEQKEQNKREMKKRLETYRVHPAHQEFVAYAAQIHEKTASVDYEV